MYLKKISENKEVKLWISELNKSFKNRSSANIPYKEVKSEDIIIDSNNILLGVYNNDDKLLGGACVDYDELSKTRCRKLFDERDRRYRATK